MKRKTIHLFGACALLLASCTNLDPDIYSDMTIDKILEDSEQSSAYLLTPMYGQMRWFNEDRSIWDLTELGTDAWVIPTNSDGGWYDGGIWHLLKNNNHEWKSHITEELSLLHLKTSEYGPPLLLLRKLSSSLLASSQVLLIPSFLTSFF